MKHEPATTIIAKLGGFRAVAGIVGKDLSRVYRWTYPKERGGTAGLIPTEDARAMLSHAKATGIDLCADDFLSTPAEAVK